MKKRREIIIKISQEYESDAKDATMEESKQFVVEGISNYYHGRLKVEAIDGKDIELT